MSTYYYMVCEDHKERTDAASRTAGGYCHLGDSDKTLLPFIIAHAGCKVEIVSEHEDAAYSREYYDWKPDDGPKWRDDATSWYKNRGR